MLSLATSMGMVKAIERYTPADWEVLGITQEDFELISGSNGWRREQLGRIMRTMNAVLFGTMEVMGLPKIVLPAEFVAAHVATLIAPENRAAACILLAQERQTGVGAMELAARQITPSQYEPASADHLFALVALLSDLKETGYARVRYKHRLGLKIEEAERKLLA